MSVSPLVRRAWAFWQQWRFERRRADRARSLRKAVPVLAVLSAKREQIARQRKAGCKWIDMQMRDAVTERLRREMGMI